eukprot:5767282-Karenia_brevis.AAC.1
MAHFGFTSRCTHTSCCVVLAPQVQEQLNMAILNLTFTLTRSQVEQCNTGELYVHPLPFRGA